MKQILKSLFTIVAVAGIVSSASYAYFTSAVTVQGMTTATGTLKIVDASEGWMGHVNFVNLKPGDTFKKWIVLKNDGTLNVDYLKISAVNESGNTGLLDNIGVSVYAQADGSGQGIYTPDWANGKPISTWLTDIDVLGPDVYHNPGSTPADILAPGKNITVQLIFKVPTTMDDTWQGQSASFDVKFVGEQSHTTTPEPPGVAF
jgi:hypothetical protein